MTERGVGKLCPTVLKPPCMIKNKIIYSILITILLFDYSYSFFQYYSTVLDGDFAGSTAQVRAERSSEGDGRVYEILFTADDGNGGVCSGSVFTGTPHNKKSTAEDSGVRFDSTSL